jgi:hypothetical protein
MLRLVISALGSPFLTAIVTASPSISETTLGNRVRSHLHTLRPSKSEISSSSSRLIWYAFQPQSQNRLYCQTALSPLVLTRFPLFSFCPLPCFTLDVDLAPLQLPRRRQRSPILCHDLLVSSQPSLLQRQDPRHHFRRSGLHLWSL